MNTVSCRDRCSGLIYDCKLHAHSDWEIIYHLQGDAIEITEDNRYPLKAGTVTVIPPGLKHKKTSTEGFLDICVQAKHLSFPSRAFTVLDHDGSIQTLMEMLIKTLIRKEACFEGIADGLLDVICLEIRKNMDSNTTCPFVDELKNIIYHNIGAQNFSLSDTIGSFGFHPDHMRRRFRQATGMTPLAYLTELRINKAKMMLLDSSFVSISDVAAKCGFRDSFYFSTCFRKSEGCSPLQFRSRLSEARKPD